MIKFFLLLICPVLPAVNNLPGFAAGSKNPGSATVVYQDTSDRQILFNGRAWRNLYSRVIGDQFLFNRDFVPGTVTIAGTTYNNLRMKYDIFNDEVLAITDREIILQLNKEMVDSFSILYNNRTFSFRRLDPDSVNDLSGYVDILYSGNISLYVKHRKIILFLEVDHKFDKFEESHKIFLEKDGIISLITGTGDLVNAFRDKKKQIRNYIRTNKINPLRKDPWSFIPVIEYCDNLLRKDDQ